MTDMNPDSASARDRGEVPSAQWPVSPAEGGFAAPGSGSFDPWSASAPAAFPAADPAGTQSLPERPPRRSRGPLIGFIAGAVVVALGFGGYLIAHNLSASRNNTPVATSAQGKAGGITVSGHGITMSFPAGWVNVPTSPNQFQQFVKAFIAEHGHVPAAVQAEATDPQMLSSFAMLVFRPSGSGFEENLNAAVGPAAPPVSQMLTALESGQGPAQFGATDLHYSATKWGSYSGVLVTYKISSQGVTAYGAQSYLAGPSNTVVTTVTSQNAATSEADLTQIVDTIRFT